MAVMRMREALRDALAEEMRRDESVFVMGEDVGVFQGAFKVTEGLLDEFGEKRVRDTPISENTIVGAGVGAAMAGLRPVVELMTVNFSLLAMDQIVNHMAAIPYMFNGQVRVPMVIRMPGRRRPPARPHPLPLAGGPVPPHAGPAGRRPVDPGRREGAAEGGHPRRQPGDLHRARDPLRRAGRGPGRRIDDGVVNFGEAAVRREGGDVTIVGILRMADVAEKAAKTLANEHRVEAEVIDPADPAAARPRHDPSLGPQDEPLVVVEEGWPHGGVGANIAALITEQAFDHLDAPTAAGHRRRRPDALCETARAGRDPARRARGQCGRWPTARRRTRSDERADVVDAAALRLDGGGDDPPLAEVAGRRGRARRRAGRDRDRQGEHGLRGARCGLADRGRRRRRGTPCRSAR